MKASGARRIEHLDHEVDDHYRVLKQLHGDRQAVAHFVESFPRPVPTANTDA